MLWGHTHVDIRAKLYHYDSCMCRKIAYWIAFHLILVHNMCKIKICGHGV